jgi:hypothetical protein
MIKNHLLSMAMPAALSGSIAKPTYAKLQLTATSRQNRRRTRNAVAVPGLSKRWLALLDQVQSAVRDSRRTACR